ncbi:YdcF family protein, partial [Pandoraea nosoerga]|nr:YdcF family protein [Pandoraea nosoerga]
AYNFALMDYALHEWIGIARYHVYNALGWNPERIHPGQA